MITTELNGGLGNQMFQYSLGKVLSIKNKTTFTLDIGILLNQKKRKYELDNYKISGLVRGQKSFYRRLFSKFSFKKSVVIVREKKFQFNEFVLRLKGNLFLSGYWQSHRYFQKYKKQILKDFTLKKPPPIPKDMESFFKEKVTVSIHVRRGDYVTDKKAAKILGTLDRNYYKKAINFIEKKFKKVFYIVFSDDLEWAEKNIPKMTSNKIIFSQKNSATSDLYFMSLCNHNIIANSSFSWWGAYLNAHRGKIVIAPKKWFKGRVVNVQDLIPPDWVKLKNTF